MSSDFRCKYSMNATLTGIKVEITVEKSGSEAPVFNYHLEERTNGYEKTGTMTVSDDIIGKVTDLVNSHLVAIKTNLVPSSLLDTSDKSFVVRIDGREHSFKSENFAKQSNDDAVDQAWKILSDYLPAEVREGAKLIFD